MVNSKDEEDDVHDVIHRLFQHGLSNEIEQQNPEDYDFVSTFDYRTMGGDTPFDDVDINNVVVAIGGWTVGGVRFAKVKRNEDGFRVMLYSNLPNGSSLGRDLFLFLARGILRDMNKSVSYLQVYEQ